MTYLEPVALKKNSLQQSPTPQESNLLLNHNFVLSEREAAAASPEAMAVCGEEDPGEGLEFLVTNHTGK